MTRLIRTLPFILLLCVLAACANASTPDPQAACPITQPEWLLAPDDSAVQNPPAYGHYYINADQSIWASAYMDKNYPLRAGKNGNKMGWFRPAGADLTISGRRLDGDSEPFEADIPCCYPTRFQATGLYFPTSGCWEVTARAAESELIFTVWVEP